MNVPYFRPSVGDQERKAVDAVLASGWLTTGKVTREFEAEFAAYLGAPHAVALNSCTAALHLALEALGVGPGDAVLVPTMTFAATAAVVRHLGARPVLVDCDPLTLCMDPDRLEAALADWSGPESLKAVLPMHYGGQMAGVFRLGEIAARYGLSMLEDAAHALPAAIRDSHGNWQKVGTTSTLTCFSFYANKCITTGEGGMLVATDGRLAERVRMMSLHGLSKSAWSRFENKGSWYYEIQAPGYKYNLTDMASALGRVQLARADQFALERRRVADMYAERFAALCEFVETPQERRDRRSAWHVYAMRLNLGRLRIDRGQFIEELKQRGITTSVHWMPLHLHPWYRETYGYHEQDFPVASREWKRLISLPIFPSMTEEEVDYVCRLVSRIARENARLRSFAVTAATGTHGD